MRSAFRDVRGRLLVGFDRAAARAEAIERFGLDATRKTLLVFGGSLGARTINEAAAGLRTVWAGRRDVQVLHIAGTAQPTIGESGSQELLFRSVSFVEDMTLAYALADLALCRGGATTVAEIDNEHIVEIHDFGRTPDGRLYLAMELLEGESVGQRLTREGKLNAAIAEMAGKHPGLVEVLRFWQQNGTAYMAMPYYDGATLTEFLRRDPRIATRIAETMAGEAA